MTTAEDRSDRPAGSGPRGDLLLRPALPPSDWENPARLKRLRRARGDLLARACGLHQQPARRILDACAGLGHDTLVLLFAGATVTACERHPAVYEQLQATVRRLRGGAFWGPLLQRLRLEGRDAIELMQSDKWDVIYLDPMYPDTRRKAAAGAEMQALAEWVGPDSDADRLLAPARAAARQRVVVKRPRRAPPLGGLHAHETLTGNSLRFDIYRPDHR